MSTKPSSYPIQKTHAKTVEQLSNQEYTLQTSSSPELLENALWLREQINLVVQTDKNLKVPYLDTISKIQGVLDKEILLMEREIENDFKHTLG